MISYFKKYFIFILTISLTLLVMFFTGFSADNSVYTVTFFSSAVLIIITGYVGPLFYLGIIKLLSKKINNFIYDCNKLIMYVGFIFAIFKPIEIFLLGAVVDFSNSILLIIVMWINLLLYHLVIFQFWKYRLEISLSLLVDYVIFRIVFGFEENLISRILENDFLINFTSVGITLAVPCLILLITIYFRRKGVYDYRSRQEKWNEKVNKGYYARFKDEKDL